MAKLYVFGIGGTGSRVIRSLIMNLASGADLGSGFNEIVPIIIDPDIANGNKEDTLSIIENYNKIREKLSENNVGFFKTKISSFKGSDVKRKDSFVFKLDGSSQTFKKFIGYNQLHEENDINKDFIDLFYSEDNLDSEMKVGFKGNPNIGSIVLNQMSQTDDYASFLKYFDKGDSIFIVSSIFGGTGAAGFPTLIKNLRKPTTNNEQQVIVKESKIGALSVLPYFKLDGTDEIDDNTFLSKTKAALDYYSDSILKQGEEDLNQMYLIGDGETNIVPYAVGAAKQKNPSHFIELASSWSIFDFVTTMDDSFKIKEYGLVKSYDGPVVRDSLGDKSKLLMNSLSRLKLLQNYCTHSIEIFEKSKGDFKGTVSDLTPNFTKTDFYEKHLKTFLDSYKIWLDELLTEKDRTVYFNPFKDVKSHDELLDFIRGKEVKKSWLKNNKTGNKLAAALDKEVSNYTADFDSGESMFMTVLFDAINKEIKE